MSDKNKKYKILLEKLHSIGTNGERAAYIATTICKKQFPRGVTVRESIVLGWL